MLCRALNVRALALRRVSRVDSQAESKSRESRPSGGRLWHSPLDEEHVRLVEAIIPPGLAA
jgi:hypothetical protein